jgi:hypothetical protein
MHCSTEMPGITGRENFTFEYFLLATDGFTIRRIPAVTIVALLFLLSCSPALRLPPANADQSRLDSCSRFIDEIYPPQFTAMQRIILSIGSQQFDFNGQLFFSQAVGFRAIGFGDMGGTFIDLLARDSTLQILKAPPQMPLNPLKDGVAGDIFFLYEFSRGSASFLFSDNTGRLDLINPAPANAFAQYTFCPGDSVLLSARQVADGKVIREVFFDEWQTPPGADHPLPARFRLKNYRWRYELSVSLLKFDNAAPLPGVFMLTDSL